MAFFALVTAANVLALCLQCIPLRSLWDMSVRAQCTSAKNTNTIIQVKGGRCLPSCMCGSMANVNSRLYFHGCAMRFSAHVFPTKPQCKFPRQGLVICDIGTWALVGASRFLGTATLCLPALMTLVLLGLLLRGQPQSNETAEILPVRTRFCVHISTSSCRTKVNQGTPHLVLSGQGISFHSTEPFAPVHCFEILWC
jgi:hypothetical protein